MCLLQNGVRCEKGPWTQSLQCQFAESDSDLWRTRLVVCCLRLEVVHWRAVAQLGRIRLSTWSVFHAHLACLILSCRNADTQLFDKVRGHDIKLLRYLSVRYICDLMVENKKVKFGLKWVCIHLFLCRLWFAVSVALTWELLSGVHSASWEQSLEEFYSRIG